MQAFIRKLIFKWKRVVPVTGAKAGSVRVIDVNGDGEIDTADNVFINTDPDWFGSFFVFRYKNFDLFMDWYTVQGVTRVNSVLAAVSLKLQKMDL